MNLEEDTRKNKNVKPVHLRWPEIREIAEKFRSEYVDPITQVPVPIIEIVEFKLCIQPIPEANLFDRLNIDGFLTKDLKHICIDQRILMEDRNINRLRFTYAHEVGHLVMHKDQINSCEFRTIEDWIHFYDDFSRDDLRWFENQANEFAGRLLVPKERLMVEIDNLRLMIEKFKSKYSNNDDILIETVAEKICSTFGVSFYVIKKRIKNENIFEELGL